MRRLTGVPAAPGIAIGTAHMLGGRVEIQEHQIDAAQIEAELRRFDEALQRSDAQLAAVQKMLAERDGNDPQVRILEAHRLMLGDVHLVEQARHMIRVDHKCAEWAVRSALDQIQAVFERIEDPYFRDRRHDVDLVGQRLLRNLMGLSDAPVDGTPRGSIAVAHDIAPPDAVQLGRAGVVAFAAEGGGRTSHTAIIARALGLPYAVGVDDLTRHVTPGATIIVDGGRGEVIIDPDDATLGRYTVRGARDRARAQLLSEIRDSPAVTTDGVRIHLSANVEMLEELPIAVDLGAEGVGLFRTEFLYLDRTELPSEEDQYGHAVAALRALEGRPANFRTLDLGGDKLPASVRMPSGGNPALGLRSIRYSLQRRDVFRTQLRALYRAAAVGPMQILFPLISGVAELRMARAVCQQVCEELAAEGIDHDPSVPIGVMVETPSAAVIADLLAAESDFLSIGTNDLIQYSLAADRQNEHVNYLYHPLHPGILRILHQVVASSSGSGKPLSMCGDMAGEAALLWILLGLGLRNLSMAPRQIPVVKSIIRGTSLTEAERLTRAALELRTENEVEDLVYDVMHRRFPVELAYDASQANDIPS